MTSGAAEAFDASISAPSGSGVWLLCSHTDTVALTAITSRTSPNSISAIVAQRATSFTG